MTTCPLLSGLHMHGHKNGLKTLLKLGPILWSGADDGCIRHDGHLVGRKSVFFFCTDARLWRCVDGECIEIVEELIPFLGGFIFKQVATGYLMLPQ